MSKTDENLPYFAFGSNLDKGQMYERCPAHKPIGAACLKDHTLWFPRFSKTWRGGGASLKAAKGKVVWGYLFALSANDWAQLDSAEGFKPDGTGAHTKQRLSVVNERKQEVVAIAYVARIETETEPTERYMETIICGAKERGLPGEWIAFLETFRPPKA